MTWRSMRTFLLAAAAALLRAAAALPQRRRRPSCSSSSRSTSSRPTCSTNIGRSSPAGSRGWRAGRCSATAIRPRRDRDLSRAIRPSSPAIASGAHRDHRQHLGRPVAVARPTRRSIAPRTSASPGTSSIALHGVADASAGADARRADEGAWPASRNVAVAGKDRAAVMMGGHTPDQRWYWDGKTLRRPTCAPRRFRPASPQANARSPRRLAAPQPPLEPPPFCASQGARRSRLTAAASRSATGRFARAAGDAAAFAPRRSSTARAGACRRR